MKSALLIALCFAGSSFARDAGALLVVGDSLSAAHNISADSGWAALLQSRLDQTGFGITVVNASISGETTAGGVTRLPDLLARHHPSVVILELGANDGLRGLPLRQMRENLDSMIASSREAGAKVLLLGIQIPSNYGPRYRDEFAKIYQDLSEKYKAGLVPFFLDGVALNPELMQSDGLHPTAAAQPMILENIWGGLQPLLGSASPSSSDAEGNVTASSQK